MTPNSDWTCKFNNRGFWVKVVPVCLLCWRGYNREHEMFSDIYFKHMSRVRFCTYPAFAHIPTKVHKLPGNGGFASSFDRNRILEKGGIWSASLMLKNWLVPVHFYWVLSWLWGCVFITMSMVHLSSWAVDVWNKEGIAQRWSRCRSTENDYLPKQ